MTSSTLFRLLLFFGLPYAVYVLMLQGSLVPARATFTTLDAPLDFIPLHIRGGSILPTQQPANSTLFRHVLICTLYPLLICVYPS